MIKTGDEKQKPKLFWVERLPNGEKVLCFSVRRHGKKQQVKLTLERIAKELKEA